MFPLLFLMACNATSDAQQSENLAKQIGFDNSISDGSSNLHAMGVGAVKIDLTSDQIEKLGIPYKKEFINLEGDEYIKYHMSLPDEILISVMMNLEGRAYLITTSSIHVKDDYGNGVGSRIADLEKSYPKGRLISGNADGNYLRFLTASPLIFLMDKSQVPESCFEFGAKCNFAKSSKVIGLEVGKYSPN